MTRRKIELALFVLSLILAPAAVAEQKTAKAEKPVLLFGQIDELSYLCSSTGLRLSSGKLPGKIDKISLGSAAAYSGVKTGDTVLNARYDDNSVTLDIERKGKRYQAKIATNVKGLREEFENRKIKFSFGESAFDKELKKLRDVKVVILMDRSKSMAETHAGVPGDISKWMWCKEQIDNVYLATDRLVEGGFDIHLFSDRVDTRTGVTLFELRQVFDNARPSGDRKNIGAPLNSVLNDYFSRRTEKSKPCIVLVITDGTENIGPPLQEVLIDASKKMKRQGEVIVTFLQIGESITAEELFDDLERNLVAKGASYNMVIYKPFAELRNRGVLYELLTALKEIRQPPKPPVAP